MYEGGGDLPEWRERYRQGLSDRKRFEPAWELCQAFIANRQWVGWHKNEQRIVEIPNPDDRERVTVNVLTQYLWTFVGKVTQDDLLPDITWRSQDVENRALARQARAATKYGWDEEWRADKRLLDIVRKTATFGTAAIRVVPEKDYGRPMGKRLLRPDTGEPVDDPEEANALLEQMLAEGRQGEFQTIYDGRLRWEALSPQNIIVPPGIECEDDFPWIIVERPVLIKTLEALYPGAKGKLKEEAIRPTGALAMTASDTPDSGANTGRLRGHGNLKTGYELPCPEYPKGRVVVWCQGVKLAEKDELPFTVNRRGHPGIVFFHYHKVEGRFWALGMIEPGVGPQRQRNRARSQWIEMKDRAGLGRVYAWESAITEVTTPKGGVFELVEVQDGFDIRSAIHETQGTPPGEWLQAEVQQNDADLDQVMGVREVSMGQAPAGVSAYSAFALLAEQDDRRVGPVLKGIRIGVAELVKVSVNGMRRYWLPQKMVTLRGEDPDGLLDAFLFNANELPEDVFVEVNTSAPLPQSQAAEVQKIFDIFDRSISSGQPLPLDWLYESLAQGKSLPLPKQHMQVQSEKADMENILLLHGYPVQPSPVDIDELHVQRHDAAVSALSLVPGMQDALMAISAHRDAHMMQAAAKAAQTVPTNNGQQAAPPQGTPGQNAGFGQMASAQQAQADPTALMGERASAAMATRMSPAPPSVR